jgi:hypothetical protein
MWQGFHVPSGIMWMIVMKDSKPTLLFISNGDFPGNQARIIQKADKMPSM